MPSFRESVGNEWVDYTAGVVVRDSCAVVQLLNWLFSLW